MRAHRGALGPNVSRQRQSRWARREPEMWAAELRRYVARYRVGRLRADPIIAGPVTAAWRRMVAAEKAIRRGRLLILLRPGEWARIERLAGDVTFSAPSTNRGPCEVWERWNGRVETVVPTPGDTVTARREWWTPGETIRVRIPVDPLRVQVEGNEDRGPPRAGRWGPVSGYTCEACGKRAATLRVWVYQSVEGCSEPVELCQLCRLPLDGWAVLLQEEDGYRWPPGSARLLGADFLRAVSRALASYPDLRGLLERGLEAPSGPEDRAEEVPS